MQYTFSKSVTTPGGGVTIPPVIVTGDIDIEAQFTVAPGASNAAQLLAITQADLQGLTLLWTANATPGATANLTIKTNSSGSPQDTITLVSGVSLDYYVGGRGTNPFAGNVSEFFMTDSTTNAVGGTLIVKALSQQ